MAMFLQKAFLARPGGRRESMNYLALLALAILLPLVLSACRQEKEYGMLVAEYSDGSTRMLFRTKVILP